MEKNKTTVGDQPEQPQANGEGTNNTAIILPENGQDVKPTSKIQRIRIEKHLPVSEMVEAVRTLYPGYDKPLHSKVENGDRYGISLREDAEQLLIHTFAPETVKRRRSDHRKKPKRIQARVTETVYGALQQRAERRKITMQDLIEAMIFEYLQNHKEEY